MGLIKTAINTVKGAIGDQWKDAIHCGQLGNDTIMRRGIRQNPGKGSPDIIANGSVIMVEENVCMMTVDNGKITNIVTEPGAYTFDSSSAPSIFAGQIGDAFKDVWTRFTHGGNPSSQQRVVYINLMPLPGIPFGTQTPMPYFDPAYNTSIDLRFFGTFEIQIADAEMAFKFYNQVATKGSQAGDLKANDIFKTEQYKKEFMQAMMKSLNMLSNKGVRYSQISAYLDDLTSEAQAATKNNWQERGFKITNVAMSPATLTDESKKLLGDRLKADTMLGGDVQRAMMAGSVARATEAAAGNKGGAMMGFMGMNMAQQMGGNLMGGFEPAPPTHQAQQAQQSALTPPPAAGWTCSCGAVNGGNFCSECGGGKPAAPSEWKCSCGASNAGKFCSECGSGKPAGSWKCSCGVENTGKFCSECGKKPE